MLNIVLFGPPGSGKGTQAQKIKERYGLTHISTGDILRKEIAKNSELGMQAKKIIENGFLLSDDLITKMVDDFVAANVADSKGFLFDGFPRTQAQAQILDEILPRHNTAVTCMLCLDVPNDELVKRMLVRAQKENRADDKAEVIEKRMHEYETKTMPVKYYYESRNLLVNIDGTGSVDDIANRLFTAIEKFV